MSGPAGDQDAGHAAPADGDSRTHDYYGVPLWLLKDYLVDLGGAEVTPDVIEGPGWRAALRKATPRHIGSLAVGGATAEFSGDEQALAALFDKLHWRTLRGGG